jgi:hypothetical protein
MAVNESALSGLGELLAANHTSSPGQRLARPLVTSAWPLERWRVQFDEVVPRLGIGRQGDAGFADDKVGGGASETTFGRHSKQSGSRPE